MGAAAIDPHDAGHRLRSMSQLLVPTSFRRWLAHNMDWPQKDARVLLSLAFGLCHRISLQLLPNFKLKERRPVLRPNSRRPGCSPRGLLWLLLLGTRLGTWASKMPRCPAQGPGQDFTGRNAQETSNEAPASAALLWQARAASHGSGPGPEPGRGLGCAGAREWH